MYRSELVRLQKEEATLRNELARHETDAAKARAAASGKRRSATSASSISMVHSYIRGAEAEEKKAAEATKKAAGVQDKLATNASRQRDKQRSLDSSLKSEQSARDRADDSRRRKEKDHAREIARLSRPTVHYVHMREPEPEKLRVLYMTASPPGATDPLRLDAEVNNVLRAIRGSRHRDLIDIRPRPAASPQDLIDGINDFRPHVVHFSGHGGPDGLLFDNASVTDPQERLVSFASLAKLLAATDQPPTLVFLNACDTADEAAVLLDAIPALIAMDAPIGDASAAVFSTQFYAAVGGAQPLSKAVEQAKAATEIALDLDMDLVTLRVRPDIDATVLRLVAP